MAVIRFIAAVCDCPNEVGAAKHFERMRRARNQLHYAAAPVGRADADKAIEAPQSARADNEEAAKEVAAMESQVRHAPACCPLLRGGYSCSFRGRTQGFITPCKFGSGARRCVEGHSIRHAEPGGVSVFERVHGRALLPGE